MADDRLDDAIDAVVRAVDRIERATRRQVVPGEAPADAPILDEHEDLQPPTSGVAPGRDAWEPVMGGAGDGHDRPGKKHKGKKKKHGHHHEDDVEVSEVEAGAVNAPQPTAPPAPAPTSHAPAEVHELVGRIVARTQELDDHLEAARGLRSEITELVARLAAASTQQR